MASSSVSDDQNTRDTITVASATSPPPSEGPPFQCVPCCKTFKRAEHLKRHKTTHDVVERAHVCPTCGKRFARSDVLARHQFVHSPLRQMDSEAGPRQPRACTACARARERCSRGVPCQRCTLRMIKCDYRHARKGRSSAANAADDGSSSREQSAPQPQSLQVQAEADAVPPEQRLQHQPLQHIASPDFSISSAAVAPPYFHRDIDLSMNWLPTSGSFDASAFFEVLGTTSSGGENQLSSGWSLSETASVSGGSSTTNRSSRDKAQRGKLYATSSSARAVSFGREKSPLPQVPGTHAQKGVTSLSSKRALQHPTTPLGSLRELELFPEDNLDANLESSSSPRVVWPSTHQKMATEFKRLCVDCDTCDELGLAADNFPTRSQMSMFVRLFYSHFLPTLPILHENLSSANDFWILTVAMAAIGCQYTKIMEFDSLVPALHEFLRRALKASEDARLDVPLQVHYVQALLLSQVGLLYYGPAEMRSHAMARRGFLVHRAESIGLLGRGTTQPATNVYAPIGGVEGVTERWHLWVQEETRSRLGYSIWMLDIMTLYHFGARPLLSHQVPQGQLPHDSLWTASHEDEWSQMLKQTSPNPPISSAIRRIFQEKETKPDIGEFGRVLLLHGIFHEINQVRFYYQRPLSTWIPNALHPSPAASSPQSVATPWLNETHTFAAWRNAALDCVDVLHWWANGMIALQSGMEHPTVLHLHFSRIVLLVPIEEILLLVTSVADHSTNDDGDERPRPSTAEVYEAEREVLRWAHRDESKARLAAIHCGCVFWHLRRFSTMAFYESQCILIATLTLWAYSYCASRGRTMTAEEAVAAPEPDSEPNDDDPEFIWLDRPNDDEMVQYFVRSGRPDVMKAYVSAVGDIYEPGSPAKILKAGLKILDTVAFAWGRDGKSVDLLERAALFIDMQERETG